MLIEISKVSYIIFNIFENSFERKNLYNSCKSTVLLVLLILHCQIPSGSGYCNPESDSNLLRTLPSDLSLRGRDNSTKRNAITIIVQDIKISPMKELVAMLDKQFLDNLKSDVIIFHDTYPFSKEIGVLRASTKRSIDFVNVRSLFHRPSCHDGFNPYTNDPTWFKREKWSYHNMIRFWFSDIFKLDVMQNVEFFMRFDDDSEFTATVEDLFKVMGSRGAVYLANEQIVEVGKKHLPGIVPRLMVVDNDDLILIVIIIITTVYYNHNTECRHRITGTDSATIRAKQQHSAKEQGQMEGHVS